MDQIPQGYAVRQGFESDIPSLQTVDLAASRLFEPTGLIHEDDGPTPIPAKALLAGVSAGLLFVITGPFGEPVGFALARVTDPDLYLEQISVSPAHGRRHLGSRLLHEVITAADAARLRGVVLSTFRDLPWNGPFYARHGFAELPRSAMKAWMKALERQQAQTMDVSLRCFMRRPGAWDRQWSRPIQKLRLDQRRP